MVASAGIDYDTHTGRMRERHAGRRHDAVDTAPGERTAASGCALLVARGTWQRVGLFDERYFFGFEDIDFCLRAGAAGHPHASGGRRGGVPPGRRHAGAARRAGGSTSPPGTTCSWRTTIRGGGPLAGLVRPFTVRPEHRARADLAGGSRAGKLRATLRGISDYLAGRTGEPSIRAVLSCRLSVLGKIEPDSNDSRSSRSSAPRMAVSSIR